MNDHCHVAIRHAACMALGLLAACAGEPPADDLAPGTSNRASITDADLVVRAVSGPPSAMPGAPLQIAAEVCNQGGMHAPDSIVRVALSADDIADAGDLVFAEQSVPFLAPGACARVRAPGIAPGGPEPVTRYHLVAVADVHDMVIEADEANNAGAGRVLAVGYEADLVVDRVRAPATAAPGGGGPGGPGGPGGVPGFEVEVRVCNQGQAPSYYSWVELHLAEEGNPAPLPIGMLDVPYLDRGDCFNATARPYLWQAPAVYQLVATVDPGDSVPELIEDNNTHAASRLGVGYEADLVVTAIAAPGSAGPGSSQPLSVTVCNQGHSPVYQTFVEVLLSEDDEIDRMNDVFAGYAQVPSLQPAQCATAPGQLYAPSLQGAFRLAAVVDGYDAQPEIFEDNNTLIGDLFGVGWDADLVVTEVTAATGVSSWWPYEDFDARVRVCNRGQQQSYGAYVNLVFSTDDEITSADPWAGEAYVSDLAPGACTRVQTRAFAPPGEGAYVLGAIVDPHEWVVELIETNNAAAGPRIGVGHGPDLVVTAVHAPALAHAGGSDSNVFVQVCNHGRGPSYSTTVDLHASRNDDISVDDVFVGREHLWHLEAGACTSTVVRAMLDVPQHGSYLLGAVVDSDEMVPEVMEDNNVRFSAPVGIGYGPDLVVTAVTAPPSVHPGASFEVSATVCNQGFVPSYNVPLFVLASEDAHVNIWNDQHLGFAFVDHLQPGQCHTAIMPGWSPYGSAPWLAAVVDPDGHLDEIREDNNLRIGQRIGVGHEPDLVVAAVSAPPTVRPYEPLEVTARVCNQGQGSGGGTDVVVHLGDGAPFSPGQPPAGMAYVPWLEPGACSDVVVLAHTMSFLGEQALTATVDPHRWLYELVEDNNTASTRIGIGHEADLIVAEVTGPASVQPWAPFDVTARVCNQGQWDGHGARLDVVLSPDALVDASDLVLGTIPLPFLGPSACEDVTLPAQAFVFRGVYTLGAVVHQGYGPPELVTSNNGTAGGLLAIGWDADLVITAVTGPASAVTGSEVAIDVEVCNQGQGPSYGTDIWVVLSRDAIVDMGDTHDAPGSPAPIGSLPPGACEVASVTVHAYQPEGRYVLGALVDPWGTAYELVESNNTGAGTTLDIVPF